MQLSNVIVLSIDCLQVLQCFNAAQARQPVPRQINRLEIGQLAELAWNLEKSVAAQVKTPFISAFRASNRQFNVTHSFRK